VVVTLWGGRFTDMSSPSVMHVIVLRGGGGGLWGGAGGGGRAGTTNNPSSQKKGEVPRRVWESHLIALRGSGPVIREPSRETSETPCAVWGGNSLLIV